MLDAPERHVSTPARVFVGLAAVLGAWQVAWIIAEADRLSLRLPAPWNPTIWVVLWAAVLITSGWAAITGRDCHVRVALVVLAAVEAMGVAVAVTDSRPIGQQFWTIGQAVVLVGACFGTLISPLRSPLRRDERH